MGDGEGSDNNTYADAVIFDSVLRISFSNPSLQYKVPQNLVVYFSSLCIILKMFTETLSGLREVSLESLKGALVLGVPRKLRGCTDQCLRYI
jgi:hypothetical protein